MKFKKLLIVAALYFFTLNAFATESAAKEDTTPPPAEGALTADQIPPIMNIGKPMPSTGTQQSAPTQLQPGNTTPQLQQ